MKNYFLMIIGGSIIFSSLSSMDNQSCIYSTADPDVCCGNSASFVGGNHYACCEAHATQTGGGALCCSDGATCKHDSKTACFANTGATCQLIAE
jgi:hypothetical protein